MSQINRGNNERGVTLRIRIRKPTIASIRRLLVQLVKKPLATIRHSRYRWHILGMTAVFVIGTFYSIIAPILEKDAYALDAKSNALLPEVSEFAAKNLNYKMTEASYDFQPGADSPTSDLLGKPSYSSAKLSQDPKKVSLSPIRQIKLILI